MMIPCGYKFGEAGSSQEVEDKASSSEYEKLPHELTEAIDRLSLSSEVDWNGLFFEDDDVYCSLAFDGVRLAVLL